MIGLPLPNILDRWASHTGRTRAKYRARSFLRDVNREILQRWANLSFSHIAHLIFLLRCHELTTNRRRA
jgi:hypothetical protein